MRLILRNAHWRVILCLILILLSILIYHLPKNLQNLHLLHPIHPYIPPHPSPFPTLHKHKHTILTISLDKLTKLLYGKILRMIFQISHSNSISFFIFLLPHQQKELCRDRRYLMVDVHLIHIITDLKGS